LTSIFPLTANACDCHMHLFGPAKQFPYAENRSYTPPDATIEQYMDVAGANNLSRFVLIQPSVYGVDNSLLLSCLRQYKENARGVVVVHSSTQAETLEQMDVLGVRGVRFNLLFPGGPGLDDLQELSHRIKAKEWHIQLLMDVAKLPEIVDLLLKCETPLVFDHFGHFNPASSSGKAGFECLLELAGSGKAWVKLSAPYRFSLGGPPYAELQRVTEQLLLANESRLLWGSDWPHPQAPETPLSLRESLSLFANWVGDREILKKIMVDNPQELYRF